MNKVIMKGLKIGLLSLCAVSVITMGLVPISANAGPNIRMYKLNKKQQQRRIIFGDAVKEPGCHNLIVSRKVHRVAQVGFAWCSLYAEDDCAPDSVLPAMWTGEEYHKYEIDGSQPQAKFYPGSHWEIISSKTPVQSWYCEAAPDL